MFCEYGDRFIPRRATKYSAGYDILVPVKMYCRPGFIKKRVYHLDTGVHLENRDIPEDCVAKIYPRSSTGKKYGLKLANTVPIIDADYRDSIHIWFTVDKPVTFNEGDRIVQMVFTKYITVRNEIPPSKERDGGVGSTGVGL